MEMAILIALAAYGLLDAWINGSIFADYRAQLQVHNNRLSLMVFCVLCIGFWVTLALDLLSGLQCLPWLAGYGLLQILDRLWPIKEFRGRHD